MKASNYISEYTDRIITDEVITLSEFKTIAVSILGILVAVKLCHFFWFDKRTLSKRLFWEYFTDSLAFGVLLVMGIGLFMNWSLLVKYDVVIRPYITLWNVYVMWRLYNHYKNV